MWFLNTKILEFNIAFHECFFYFATCDNIVDIYVMKSRIRVWT